MIERLNHPIGRLSPNVPDGPSWKVVVYCGCVYVCLHSSVMVGIYNIYNVMPFFLWISFVFYIPFFA